MSFALLGVIAMQLYFLRQSYQMQSELFDRSVNEALNNVVAKVTKHDAQNFLNIKARRDLARQNAWNDNKINAENGINPVAQNSLAKMHTDQEINAIVKKRLPCFAIACGV